MEKPGKKVLVFSVTCGIGDMIMAIPMLRLLHQKMPGAEIILGVLSGAGQLFETCPFIRRVIKVETKGDHLMRRNLKLLLEIRRDYEFDLCVETCITGHLYLSIDSMIARCIKAKRRIGFSLPMTRFSFLPFQFLPLMLDDTLTIDFSKHYVVNNVELLGLAGIYPDNGIPEMELWLSEEDITAADRFLMGRDVRAGDMIIGIHPGGNQWVMKRWPKERFAALADRLPDEYPNAKVLVFGGPDEERLKHDVANLAKDVKPTVVTAMSLRKTAALIKRCDLFIANDSSLMHIAAAVKTPVVGIFGPTSPSATGPYSRRSEVVTNRICKLDCRPCYNKVNFAPIRFTCKQDPPYACLTQLPVSEVLKAAKRLLDKVKR
jgi:lipopolysaccharide heptosyltransferase II